MPVRTDLVYRYDGTYDGFLCCVFESFYAKEFPCAIERYDTAQETLFPKKEIDTDEARAKRVAASIPQKISKEAESLVKRAFLCALEEKELKMLAFLRLGYRVGGKVTKLTTDDRVDVLVKAVQYLGNEAHYSLEFLRFSQYDAFLAAQITPKNNVLPLMVHHFCDRFPDENFIIYDKAHKTAFFHQSDGKTGFLYETDIQFPDPDAEEENYRRLWRHFYQTIAVEGRINAKLRRTNMPMRYWPNMTEFQEENVPVKQEGKTARRALLPEKKEEAQQEAY